MVTIVGIKFRTSGKLYYFEPGEFNLKYEDNVIVETARGMEFGTVMLAPRKIHEENLKQPLKPVVRLATDEDREQEKENREKEKHAYEICKSLILKHELDMKLISSEYTFDRSKLLFYFTADGRIDFRELVKDLAGVFKTRIELRQVGVRDETKLLGGIGVCGRPLCCATYLHEFAPVSIKMAKEQNLSLNQSKISGTCGRLMCCLKNEEETYEYLSGNLPRKGDIVTTPDGIRAEVQSTDILRQNVKVLISTDDDEKESVDYHVSELKFKRNRKKSEKESDNENAKNDSESKELGKITQHENNTSDDIHIADLFEEENILEDSAEEYMKDYDLSAYYGEEGDGTKSENGDIAVQADANDSESAPDGASEHKGRRNRRSRYRNRNRNRNKENAEGGAALSPEAVSGEASNGEKKEARKEARPAKEARPVKEAKPANTAEASKENGEDKPASENGNHKRRRRRYYGKKKPGGEKTNAE